MRVAVLGCGSIGRRHALNLKALGATALALVDADYCRANAVRDALHEHAGGRLAETMATTHIRNLMVDDPEAVLICTPASTHAAVARELLAAGYAGPLFVEKPLALSLDECEVFRTWPHPVTQVGYQLRFNPDARALRARFDPTTGGSFMVRTDMRTWPGHHYGPLLYEASHELDLALWCGAPATVQYASMTEERIYIALGEAWTVSLYGRDAGYCRDWAVFGEVQGYQQAFGSPADLGDQMYRDELAHFLACVRTQTPTSCPFAEGLKVLDVCQQVETLTKQTA